MRSCGRPNGQTSPTIFVGGLAIVAKRRDTKAVTIEEVFSAILPFREATDAFSLRMERHFDGVDARLDGIDARLDGHDRRFDQLDVRIGRIETRIEHLEDGQREIRNELVEINQRFLR